MILKRIFIIPERFDELIHWTKITTICIDQQDIESQIKRTWITKITREQSQYDEYDKQYEYLRRKDCSLQKNYEKAQSELMTN